MSRPVRCQSGCLGVVLVLAVSSLALAQETPAFAQPQPPVDSPLPAPVNPGVLNPHPSIFTEALYKGLYEPLAKHPPHKRAKHKQPRGLDSPPPALAPRSNHPVVDEPRRAAQNVPPPAPGRKPIPVAPPDSQQ